MCSLQHIPFSIFILSRMNVLLVKKKFKKFTELKNNFFSYILLYLLLICLVAVINILIFYLIIRLNRKWEFQGEAVGPEYQSITIVQVRPGLPKPSHVLSHLENYIISTDAGIYTQKLLADKTTCLWAQPCQPNSGEVQSEHSSHSPALE